MILILSSSYNTGAEYLKQFSDEIASVFTCSDLAEQKTRLRFPSFSDSEITIHGKPVPIPEIKGVINLLPVVLPGELYFFPEEEREYQSAEFQALLTFFLTALPCPVINRPSPLGLGGKYNHPVRWAELAGRLKIPMCDFTIDSDSTSNPFGKLSNDELTEVICFNSEIISPSQPEADEYTRQLALHSDMVYLKAIFKKTGAKIEFVRGSSIPDVRNKELVERIIQYFKMETVQ